MNLFNLFSTLSLLAIIELPSSVVVESSNSSRPEKRLLGHLFKDYTELYPYCNGTNFSAAAVKEPLHVYITPTLLQIVEVNEVGQSITLNMGLDLAWHDCRLEWMPAEYDGLDMIEVPTQEPLWIPDLTYIERMDHRVRWRRESVAVAMHDGTVGLTSQLVMRAGCPIDVRYYPFDRQACNITIASWTYATNLLYLNFTDKGAALSIKILHSSSTHRAINGVWRTSYGNNSVKNTMDSFTLAHVSCFAFAADFYTYWYMCEALYHLMALMFPCALISLVCSLVFVIPAENQEKVTLSMTILLTIVVFMQLMFTKLPETAESVPLLCQYFASCIVLVSCSCVAAVCVNHVHSLGTSADQPTPSTLTRSVPTLATAIINASNDAGELAHAASAVHSSQPVSPPTVPRWIRFFLRALGSRVPALIPEAALFCEPLQQQEALVRNGRANHSNVGFDVAEIVLKEQTTLGNAESNSIWRRRNNNSIQNTLNLDEGTVAEMLMSSSRPMQTLHTAPAVTQEVTLLREMRRREEWRIFAKILNRLFFLLSIGATAVLLIAVLSIGYYHIYSEGPCGSSLQPSR